MAQLDANGSSDGRFHIVKKVAKDRVISTVDTEARHGHKSANRHFAGERVGQPVVRLASARGVGTWRVVALAQGLGVDGVADADPSGDDDTRIDTSQVHSPPRR